MFGIFSFYTLSHILYGFFPHSVALHYDDLTFEFSWALYESFNKQSANNKKKELRSFIEVALIIITTKTAKNVIPIN